LAALYTNYPCMVVSSVYNLFLINLYLLNRLVFVFHHCDKLEGLILKRYCSLRFIILIVI
jgi:hypothetical protein